MPGQGVAEPGKKCHNIHMKRTNLVLDESLLKTATRLLGVKTYSAAVNKALEEAIRVARIRGLGEMMGTGIWEGDLKAMREDPPARPGKARREK